MRGRFFGAEASTRDERRAAWPSCLRYRHHDVDIRDGLALEPLFAEHGADLSLIVHAAAQPSHDWAVRDPLLDFDVNATATYRLLELTRRHAPGAAFVFTSTNKVYGDAPNRLPLVELETRWEIDPAHPFADGIDETHVGRSMPALAVRRRRSCPPICWCRSTAGISVSGRRRFAAAASPALATSARSSTAFSPT